MSVNQKWTISVVMATYNGAKYIAEQLDSIVNQTLQPTEVIICDDCSTDNTVEIVNLYRSKLNIKLKINEKNLGYTSNYELALSLATGTYIALCDQDDIWKPRKLEILLDNIGDFSLVYSNSDLMDSDGKSMQITLSEKLRNKFISASSPLSFVFDNCVSAHSMLFHHSLVAQLLPFPQKIFFDAWVAANAASVNGVYFVNQSLVHYRLHSNNTVGNNKKQKKTIFQKIKLKADLKKDIAAQNVQVITDLLQIQSLGKEDRNTLEELKNEYLKFEKKWFNFSLYTLLRKNGKYIFAITKKNPNTLAFKKSLGLRMYKLFPFL